MIKKRRSKLVLARTFWRSESAQSVAEIAISIPVLLLFFGLTIQSVLIVNGTMMTSYAAYQAARVGMLLQMSYNVVNTLPDYGKGEVSQAEFFSLVQQPVMHRVATICLVPLRYRTVDPISLGTGVGRAYIDDFVFLFQQTPTFPNISGDYFRGILSQIWSADQYLVVAKNLANQLLSMVLSPFGMGDLNGDDDYGSALTNALKDAVKKMLGLLAGDLLNTFESVLLAFNPFAGMKSRICEVERMTDIDSESPLVAFRTDNRIMAVRVTHHFRLDIPFANRLVYLLYNVDPDKFSLDKIWRFVVPKNPDDLTIDLVARANTAVPKVVSYSGGGTEYIVKKDVDHTPWISGEPKHYQTLDIK